MDCHARSAVHIRTGQSGAFLLEGLLAIVVFSIGLLALVSLQAQAIKQSGDAKYRADAAFLADQIISQIWVDRANIATYAFGPNTTTAPSCGTPPTATPNCAINGWLTRVAATLPGATAARQTIAIPVANDPTNAANNVVTVTIQWQAAQDTGVHNHVAVAQIQ